MLASGKWKLCFYCLLTGVGKVQNVQKDANLSKFLPRAKDTSQPDGAP